MNQQFLKRSLMLGLCLFMGFILGRWEESHWESLFSSLPIAKANTAKPREPLYWVAPMDSHYRRDAPGKSPMGMDLIPVYDDAQTEGSIKVSNDILMSFGVKTHPVAFGQLQTTIKTFGYTRWNQDSVRHHHPRIAGWIKQLHVKTQGETIKKGQPLYALYSPELVNAQAEFILALNQKNIPLIIAAESRLRAFQVQTDFIKALKTTRKIQQNILTRAEYSGILLDLPINEGMYVTPDKPLFSTVSMDEIWVMADILESHVHQIKTGLTVSMTIEAIPNRTFKGVIDFIDPQLSNHRIKARIRLKNTGFLLKPNMLAMISIKLQPLNNTLLVPTQSVIKTEQKERVILALGEGLFKAQAIITGRSANGLTQVIQGLSEGQTIVTHSQFLLDTTANIDSAIERLSSEIDPESDSNRRHSTHNHHLHNH
jgi:Cu(I)/Ag(I) efflux system membrane fusion protein